MGQKLKLFTHRVNNFSHASRNTTTPMNPELPRKVELPEVRPTKTLLVRGKITFRFRQKLITAIRFFEHVLSFESSPSSERYGKRSKTFPAKQVLHALSGSSLIRLRTAAWSNIAYS